MLARFMLVSMLGAVASAGYLAAPATSYVQSTGPVGYGYGGYGSYGSYGGYPGGYGSTYVTPHSYGSNVKHAYGGTSYAQRNGYGNGNAYGYGNGLGYGSGYGSGYGYAPVSYAGVGHYPLATSYSSAYQVAKPAYYSGYGGYGSY